MKKQTTQRISIVLLAVLLVSLVLTGATAADGAFGTGRAVSEGVQNIVKRAYQMTNIQWTPKKDIIGWNNDFLYRAGTTYTGLPYGQPVNASYVPWSTSLEGFIAAVNDPDSRMYTSVSEYNRVAPYYSVDCSAFVSWAWQLPRRQDTRSIHNYATEISRTSYADMEIGDCLCLAGEHVVLVTDMTYDWTGTITGVEISESTVNYATAFCCQRTWYGDGHEKSMNYFREKYFGGGYILYRSNTRDQVQYVHSCVVPLDGDDCPKCQFQASPVYARLTARTEVSLYEYPDTSSAAVGTAVAGSPLTVTAYTEAGDGWYLTEGGYWVPAGSVVFDRYLPSVTVTGKDFPSGTLASGAVFPICGEIRSVDPLKSITAEIFAGSGTGGMPVQSKTVNCENTFSYSLRGSPIDIAMVFNALADGQYTFVLTIRETASCPAGGTQELSTVERSAFAVGVNAAPTPTAFGIDVSHHQKTINWAVVAPQIDFAILRCGYGDDMVSQDDTEWHNNARGCTEQNIPFGVYIFSYALTDEQARSEAQHVLRLVQGYGITLPIYLDLEWEQIALQCTKAEILRHAQIFCDAIESAGYRAGVYANRYWWNTYLTDPAYNQWDRWLAEFASEPTYSGTYTVWQYSETGRINGISTNVDLDRWYGELPARPHEHDYRLTEESPATCTRDGQKTYVCECGNSYSEPIPALGHDHSEWTASQEATCTASGLEERQCHRCGQKEQRELPPLSHDYRDGVCVRCGARNPDAILLGDVNGDGDITSADSVLLARYLVDLAVLSPEQQFAADLNRDGEITTADSVLLARYLVGVYVINDTG